MSRWCFWDWKNYAWHEEWPNSGWRWNCLWARIRSAVMKMGRGNRDWQNWFGSRTILMFLWIICWSGQINRDRWIKAPLGSLRLWTAPRQVDKEKNNWSTALQRCGNRDRRKFCVIDDPRQYENLRLSQEWDQTFKTRRRRLCSQYHRIHIITI